MNRCVHGVCTCVYHRERGRDGGRREGEGQRRDLIVVGLENIKSKERVLREKPV